jgi:hypothetical protein
MTNASGIRRVWITNMKDGAGNKVELSSWGEEDNWLARRWELDGGGVAEKSVQLVVHSTPVRVIKVLEGDVELFCPTRFNDGIVKVSRELTHVGAIVSDPVLERNGVKFRFLDVKNFATTIREIERTNGPFQLSREYIESTRERENAQDALLFSLEDPRGVVLDGWPEVTFFDMMGHRMNLDGVSFLNRRLEYFNGKLPQRADFIFHLMPPELSRVVHFKVENIAVR